MCRLLRPGWHRADIILWQLGPTCWAGYSVLSPQDKLVVRLAGGEGELAARTARHAHLVKAGLAPPLLASGPDCVVTQYFPPYR